ncbi:hypothetical protein ACROYT_G018671 [Oculina patagonica]
MKFLILFGFFCVLALNVGQVLGGQVKDCKDPNCCYWPKCMCKGDPCRTTLVLCPKSTYCKPCYCNGCHYTCEPVFILSSSTGLWSTIFHDRSLCVIKRY